MDNIKIQDLKQYGESIVKSVMGAVPIVGGLLNEVFFDLWSRIKQERINIFFEELTIYVNSSPQTKFDFKYIKSENFTDLFLSVLKRVLTTSSIEKISRFKIVLFKGLTNSLNLDNSETFLDLVLKITETEIIILNHYRKIKCNEIIPNDKILDRGEIDGNHINCVSEFRKSSFFKLSEQAYKQYVQNLYSKGLLIDDGINRFGIKPFEILEISELGLAFLNFIEESNPSNSP